MTSGTENEDDKVCVVCTGGHVVEAEVEVGQLPEVGDLARQDLDHRLAQLQDLLAKQYNTMQGM